MSLRQHRTAVCNVLPVAAIGVTRPRHDGDMEAEEPEDFCRDNGETYEVGAEWSDPGLCNLKICRAGGVIEIKRCPYPDVPDGCRLGEPDLAQTYPYCCPKAECSYRSRRSSSSSSSSSSTSSSDDPDKYEDLDDDDGGDEGGDMTMDFTMMLGEAGERGKLKEDTTGHKGVTNPYTGKSLQRRETKGIHSKEGVEQRKPTGCEPVKETPEVKGSQKTVEAKMKVEVGREKHSDVKTAKGTQNSTHTKIEDTIKASKENLGNFHKNLKGCESIKDSSTKVTEEGKELSKVKTIQIAKTENIKMKPDMGPTTHDKQESKAREETVRGETKTEVENVKNTTAQKNTQDTVNTIRENQTNVHINVRGCEETNTKLAEEGKDSPTVTAETAKVEDNKMKPDKDPTSHNKVESKVRTEITKDNDGKTEDTLKAGKDTSGNVHKNMKCCEPVKDSTKETEGGKESAKVNSETSKIENIEIKTDISPISQDKEESKGSLEIARDKNGDRKTEIEPVKNISTQKNAEDTSKASIAISGNDPGNLKGISSKEESRVPEETFKNEKPTLTDKEPFKVTMENSKHDNMKMKLDVGSNSKDKEESKVRENLAREKNGAVQKVVKGCETIKEASVKIESNKHLQEVEGRAETPKPTLETGKNEIMKIKTDTESIALGKEGSKVREDSARDKTGLAQKVIKGCESTKEASVKLESNKHSQQIVEVKESPKPILGDSQKTDKKDETAKVKTDMASNAQGKEETKSNGEMSRNKNELVKDDKGSYEKISTKAEVDFKVRTVEETNKGIVETSGNRNGAVKPEIGPDNEVKTQKNSENFQIIKENTGYVHKNLKGLESSKDFIVEIEPNKNVKATIEGKELHKETVETANNKNMEVSGESVGMKQKADTDNTRTDDSTHKKPILDTKLLEGIKAINTPENVRGTSINRGEIKGSEIKENLVTPGDVKGATTVDRAAGKVAEGLSKANHQLSDHVLKEATKEFHDNKDISTPGNTMKTEAEKHIELKENPTVNCNEPKPFEKVEEPVKVEKIIQVNSNTVSDEKPIQEKSKSENQLINPIHQTLDTTKDIKSSVENEVKLQDFEMIKIKTESNSTQEESKNKQLNGNEVSESSVKENPKEVSQVNNLNGLEVSEYKAKDNVENEKTDSQGTENTTKHPLGSNNDPKSIANDEFTKLLKNNDPFTNVENENTAKYTELASQSSEGGNKIMSNENIHSDTNEKENKSNDKPNTRDYDDKDKIVVVTDNTDSFTENNGPSDLDKQKEDLTELNHKESSEKALSKFSNEENMFWDQIEDEELKLQKAIDQYNSHNMGVIKEVINNEGKINCWEGADKVAPLMTQEEEDKLIQELGPDVEFEKMVESITDKVKFVSELEKGEESNCTKGLDDILKHVDLHKEGEKFNLEPADDIIVKMKNFEGVSKLAKDLERNDGTAEIVDAEFTRYSAIVGDELHANPFERFANPPPDESQQSPDPTKVDHNIEEPHKDEADTKEYRFDFEEVAVQQTEEEPCAEDHNEVVDSHLETIPESAGPSNADLFEEHFHTTIDVGDDVTGYNPSFDASAGEHEFNIQDYLAPSMDESLETNPLAMASDGPMSGSADTDRFAPSIEADEEEDDRLAEHANT